MVIKLGRLHRSSYASAIVWEYPGDGSGYSTFLDAFSFRKSREENGFTIDIITRGCERTPSLIGFKQEFSNEEECDTFVRSCIPILEAIYYLGKERGEADSRTSKSPGEIDKLGKVLWRKDEC